jgi:hypothetical protein
MLGWSAQVNREHRRVKVGLFQRAVASLLQGMHSYGEQVPSVFGNSMEADDNPEGNRVAAL